MISVDGLTVEFGGTTLFSDISFQINEKDRIALMGRPLTMSWLRVPITRAILIWNLSRKFLP